MPLAHKLLLPSTTFIYLPIDGVRLLTIYRKQQQQLVDLIMQLAGEGDGGGGGGSGAGFYTPYFLNKKEGEVRL
mgnify:CR=1 FL=1